MIYVTPLFRSQLWVSPRGCPFGLHRSVCLSQAGRCWQVDPDHERPPVCRRESAGTYYAEPFAPEALYELKIDTNGDAVADITYRVRFSSSKGGTQTATLRRVEGAQAAATGDDGQIIVEGVPVSTGRDARVTQAGDYRFFAGWRSDPFFFDVAGALNNLQFTGDDFFADKDVCSIVLEVPNSVLGPKEVGLWARTLIPATSAGGTGSRQIAARGPTKLPSLPASRTLPTSLGSRWTMPGLLPFSRMHWSMRVV